MQPSDPRQLRAIGRQDLAQELHHKPALELIMAELVAVVSETPVAAGIAFISAALAPFNLVFGLTL